MTPDPDTVTDTLADHDGEATLGEIASELSARPSAVSNTLSKLAEWGVVVNKGSGERWRLTSIEDQQAAADFEDQASDRPCPLGCGYRPVTARDAGAHLVRHLTGTHTTGEQQYRNRAEYVD